jgi:methylated-DNA-[protein]-cysteine S-methyltransferase
MRASLTIETEIGPLTVTETDGALAALDWGARAAAPRSTPLLKEAARQIRAYLKGGLTSFDVPLAVRGSEFQRRVFEAMRAIPYGRVMSYGDLARATGSAPRAVGGACGANPLPLFIPCHRVIASGGRLGGYGGHGGLSTKRYLLGLEGALADLR